MTISSLFGTIGSAASAYGGITSANPATQTILDAVAKATGATTGGATGNGVTISTDAKLAAAEAADKGKDFTALTAEVRQTLDKGDADMTRNERPRAGDDHPQSNQRFLPRRDRRGEAGTEQSVAPGFHRAGGQRRAERARRL